MRGDNPTQFRMVPAMGLEGDNPEIATVLLATEVWGWACSCNLKRQEYCIPNSLTVCDTEKSMPFMEETGEHGTYMLLEKCC